jgi:hypothetical protein
MCVSTIRRLAAAAITAIVVLALSPVAVAENPPPIPGASAVWQYVEAVPSAGGSVAAGTQRKRKISPVLHKEIASAGKDAAALAGIVQSASAPIAKPQPPRARVTVQPRSKPELRTSSPSVFATPLRVVLDHPSRWRVLGLVAVLLATAAAMIAGIGRRQHEWARRRHDTQPTP